jgi:hypothetical protein
MLYVFRHGLLLLQLIAVGTSSAQESSSFVLKGGDWYESKEGDASTMVFGAFTLVPEVANLLESVMHNDTFSTALLACADKIGDGLVFNDTVQRLYNQARALKPYGFCMYKDFEGQMTWFEHYATSIVSRIRELFKDPEFAQQHGPKKSVGHSTRTSSMKVNLPSDLLPPLPRTASCGRCRALAHWWWILPRKSQMRSWFDSVSTANSFAPKTSI